MTSISTLTTELTTYESVSGDITFSGLGNGTDFTEIVETLVESESYRLEDYETKLEEQEYIVSLLEDLGDSLDALQDVLDEFDSLDSFLSMDVVASDDAVSAAATGDATATTHSIIVNQLAQADTWANTGTSFASTDTEVTAADTTLTLTYAGETLEIEVAAGSTLADLVAQVNAQTGGSVKASLINDGLAYYFLLSGADSGADNALTIEDTGTLTGFDPSGFTNTRVCGDAQFKVDGFPPGTDDWISRSSNEIDDVVEGLSLTLQDTTDGDAVTLSLGYDEEALKENIETFLTEVNQIILDIQTLTGRVTTYVTTEDGDEEEAPYINNYALNMMYANIKTILSSIGTGFVRYDADSGQGDRYSTLSQLGVSTDSEAGSDSFGQLLIDDDELDAAIAEDAHAVALLFAASGETTSDGSGLAVISTIDKVTKAGEYEVAYEIQGGELISATVDGKTALVEGWTITAMAGNAKGLYLTVIEGSDGAHTGTVNVRQGKVGELSDAIDDIIDQDNGTLTILITSCENNIETLEDDIYYEEQRLDNLESALVRKYAALDAALSTYTEMESTLESLIAQLSD